MQNPVRFFVSYAHADEQLAADFLRRLWLQLAPSRRYAYELWRDSAILAGEDWFAQIESALDQCDLGLILLSPAFLDSRFIERHELPHFVGAEAKPVVPVALAPVDLKRHDLKGLEDYQLFRLDRKTAYGQCRARAERERFVEGLFGQLEQRLDRLAIA